MFDNVDANHAHKGSLLFHSGWVTYLGVMLLSLWGGLVSYFDRRDKFSWRTLTAHLLSSSFAGMMTFFACEYAGISGPLTGVFCGVAAHMGTPALIRFAKRARAVRALLEAEGLSTGKGAKAQKEE